MADRSAEVRRPTSGCTWPPAACGAPGASGGGRAGAPRVAGQLSQRAAVGVWSQHGGRQVSRKPLDGQEGDYAWLGAFSTSPLRL